jgi:tetratricopeptide (TPR) repeat protein
MAMRTDWVHSHFRWTLALMLSLVWLGAAVRAADDDAALRKRALALNDITGNGPIAGEIKALVSDAAGTKKLLQAAIAMAKEKEQPFNYNAAYILAGAAADLKDLEAGRVFYRLCATLASKLQSGTKLADAYVGLIQLLDDNKKFEESEKVCKEFLELPDDDPDPTRRGPVSLLKSPILRHMILGMAKQGKLDEANKLVDKLLEANPENWLMLELRGQIQREAGRDAEAAKTYEDILGRINKQKELKDDDKAKLIRDYRYLLSGIYVDLNQIDKAADLLKSLLSEKPNSPTYNNDLGYIWADHDMNLDEAEKMIRKALEEDRKQRKAIPDLPPEEDKDSAAYLDSLGWVLFKKKDFKEAKKYLLLATQDQEEGQHIEILDHLADAHLALGEKADAIAVWKKALELPTPTKREKQRKVDVEKKLQAQQ